MPEKKENASTVEFLRSFGPKILSGEVYFETDDTTDQRAPVNNPEDLYNTFVVPEEIMSELDSENVDDFDNDFYDYDDRTDLGVDIAMAADLGLQRKRQPKPVEKEPEAIEPDDGPAE